MRTIFRIAALAGLVLAVAAQAGVARAQSDVSSVAVPVRKGHSSQSSQAVAAASASRPSQANYYVDTNAAAVPAEQPSTLRLIVPSQTRSASTSFGGAMSKTLGSGASTLKSAVIDKPAELARGIAGYGTSFNTDYKTRSVSASTPPSLVGRGLGGKNIPIGTEDAYRKTLPKDYMPTDLVRIPPEYCFENMVLYLRSEPARQMVRMFNDAARQGLRFEVFSAYRDYSHQARLYSESIRRGNRGSVAKPGYSEHMLGTTVDITNSSRYLMSRSFANTAEGRWLVRNAARYGWKATVVSGSGARSHCDEPWHIRYFGTGKPMGATRRDGWDTDLFCNTPEAAPGNSSEKPEVKRAVASGSAGGSLQTRPPSHPEPAHRARPLQARSPSRVLPPLPALRPPHPEAAGRAYAAGCSVKRVPRPGRTEGRGRVVQRGTPVPQPWRRPPQRIHPRITSNTGCPLTTGN